MDAAANAMPKIPALADPAEIVSRLEALGVTKDRASQYADAYAEYRQAQANISEHGSIVQHPRTGNPIQNPYLAIRDRALKRLRQMWDVPAGFLW